MTRALDRWPPEPKAELLAAKPELSQLQRYLKAFLSSLDPRVYLHAFRLLNYYNQTHIRPLRDLEIGRNPSISPNASFANGARIHIGHNARIGARTSLWAGPARGRIIVGNDLLTGPDVMITAANYRFNDGAPVTKQLMQEEDVHIGNDVWIGAGAIILPGARIGDGAIIAAGAIVRTAVPPLAIFAGVPAKQVGLRDGDAHA